MHPHLTLLIDHYSKRPRLGKVPRKPIPFFLCEPSTFSLPVVPAPFQMIEGTAFFLGATACFLFNLGPLIYSSPAITTVLVLGLLLSGAEAFLAGMVARSLNLRVRQSLGRMFGFTLDIFSKIDLVGSLGLEHRLWLDYKHFASDYFR